MAKCENFAMCGKIQGVGIRQHGTVGIVVYFVLFNVYIP